MRAAQIAQHVQRGGGHAAQQGHATQAVRDRPQQRVGGPVEKRAAQEVQKKGHAPTGGFPVEGVIGSQTLRQTAEFRGHSLWKVNKSEGDSQHSVKDTHLIGLQRGDLTGSAEQLQRLVAGPPPHELHRVAGERN